MDPDQCLKDGLKCARDFLAKQDRGETENGDGDAAAACAALIALDEWLRRGGFLPAAWKKTASSEGGDA